MFNFLFCCRRKPKTKVKIKAAGYFFTNGTHVLAGYQFKSGRPIISGIGGKIEAGEKWHRAAVREVFEELLGIDVPEGFIAPQMTNAIKSGPYIFAVSTFEDLEVFLAAAQSSPYYDEGPPRTITDLILKRNTDSQAEVHHLVLLPAMSELIIDPDFIKDISLARA
jgi:hypothetical protein